MEVTRYSIEPRRRKYARKYGFLWFARNISNRNGKQLLDNATKTRLDALKYASEIVVHKTGEAAIGVLENKIADKFLKLKAKRCCRNNYSTTENRRNIEQIKKNIIKWNTTKHLS